jgi:hypothetical protein
LLARDWKLTFLLQIWSIYLLKSNAFQSASPRCKWSMTDLLLVSVPGKYELLLLHIHAFMSKDLAPPPPPKKIIIIIIIIRDY